MIDNRTDGKFILFDVFEFDKKVGKVALFSRWTENDVLIELESRDYPTNGIVTFEGWPSNKEFKMYFVTNEKSPTIFTFKVCND